MADDHRTVADAAANGTTRDLLVSMRNRIAEQVDKAETPARDLAALTKRLADVVKEIEAIDAREDQEADNDASEVEDGDFDATTV